VSHLEGSSSLGEYAYASQTGHTQPPILLYTSYTTLIYLFTTMLTFFDSKASQLFLLARDPNLHNFSSFGPSIQHFEPTSKVGWLDLLIKHLGQILSFATFACSAVEKVEVGEREKQELGRRFERILLWSLKRLLDSRTFVSSSHISHLSLSSRSSSSHLL
jgi:hypothetical protein